MNPNHRLARLLLITLCGWITPLSALQLELKNGTQLEIDRFGSGPDRLLWLPWEYGLHGPEQQLARDLAAHGIEVWLLDLHSNYFIAPGRSSLNAIPVDDLTALIAQAHPKAGRLYLLASSRAAALTLTAARHWQQQRDPNATPLGGAILFHPNLLTDAENGEEYLPITRATNLPLLILQPGNSAKVWQLPTLADQLQQGGSDLYLRLLPQVSDGFELRDDPTEIEQQLRPRLAAILYHSLRLLDSYNQQPRPPAAETVALAAPQWHGVTSDGLQPHRGDPLPPPLELPDRHGVPQRLDDYRGQVVLVNFWATWCPPCVAEIPSMGRLQNKLQGEGFSILAVNIGETPEQIEAFLQQHPAHFPVLLDPHGESTAPWRVHAFPLSYLIDRHGQIRYAYYGALEWDAPEVVEQIRRLVVE